MAGVCKIDIQESKEQLKALLHQQKLAQNKERVQLLYLLKSGQVQSVSEAAHLLGRHRVTLQGWLSLYRQGGISALLQINKPTGRPRTVPDWAVSALEKQLQDSNGFDSYGEIQDWLETRLGVTVHYKTLHRIVYSELKASPKVARPQSDKQSQDQKEAFKKTWQTI